MREGRTTTYTAPKLVRYGDMVKLTAAGTAGQNEPANSTDQTKRL